MPQHIKRCWAFYSWLLVSGTVVSCASGGAQLEQYSGLEKDGFTSIKPVEWEPVSNELSDVPIDVVRAPATGVNDAETLADEKSVRPQQTVQRSEVASESEVLPQVELIPGQTLAAERAENNARRESEAAELVVAAAPVDELVQPSAEQPLIESALVEGSVLPIGTLRFEQGEFELSDTVMTHLEEIVSLMRENPLLKLTVEAHASAVGDTELNMLLSRQRALSVIRYLINEDVAAERLRPTAFGDSTPVANATSNDVNDRVELRVR